jgi:hypothetical protein
MSGGLFNFINHLKKEKKVEQISWRTKYKKKRGSFAISLLLVLEKQ